MIFGLTIMQAYKALALASLQRDEEATAVISDIRKSKPTDIEVIGILEQALDLMGNGSPMYTEISF
jgi:hypothetical protein